MKHPKRHGAIVQTLLQELAPPERQKLIQQLEVSRATFYRWQSAPGEAPVSKAFAICDFLSRLYGQRYDLRELFMDPSRKRARVAA